MAILPSAQGPLWGWKGRIVAAILVVVLGANWGWQVWQRRAQALTEAERLVSSLTRAAEYQIVGSLRSVQALLDEAADRVDLAAWPDPALEDWFHARLSGYPEVRLLQVLDAQGRRRGNLILPDGGTPPQLVGTGAAERDFFHQLSADPATGGLAIGAPVPSGQGWFCIPVARAIVDRSGRFAGVVVAGIDAEAMREKLAAVAVEDEGGTALLRRDALFLARFPGHERWLGKFVPESPIFRDYLPQAESGVGRFVGVADGNDKIVAYRTFAAYPLVVLVGVTNRTALTQWRAQTIKEAAANALVVVALLVLAALYDRWAAAGLRLMRELAASHDELERQVEERTAHLAASNAELAQFTYIASHDLQEPLRSVSSFLQLLQRRYGGRLDAEADEYIGFAVAGAKRMSALLNDVISYSQIARIGPPPQSCDTGALAAEAAQSLAAAAETAKADIRLGPLPPVLGVPSQMLTLFHHLLGNALKYRAVDRPVRIEVGAEPDRPGWACLFVADNGIGIEPEYHERIFKIFQRLHRREEYEGTGIGLALCQKIVEAAGGRLWVESRPGEGSVFRFTLPLADTPPD